MEEFIKKELIKGINIQNFKMFKNFSIKSFKRINLIYGKNNSGKTGLLEAIYLSLSNINPAGVFTTLRGFPFSLSQVSVNNSWDLLFYKFDSSKNIEIKIEFEDGENSSVVISKPFLQKNINIIFGELKAKLNPNSLYMKWEFKDNVRESIVNFTDIMETLQKDLLSLSQHISPSPSILSLGNFNFLLKPEFYFAALGKPVTEMLTKVYGELVRKGLKPKLIECIKSVDNSVEEIDIINMAGIPCIGIKTKGNDFYPIDTMGEGFTKIFSIISLMLDKKDGVVLIDEIENGIYWEVQGKFWKYLEKYAEEFNVQVFATTHSYEFLKNTVNNLENPNNIAGIKVKQIEDNLEPIIIQGEDFVEMIKADFEVR